MICIQSINIHGLPLLVCPDCGLAADIGFGWLIGLLNGYLFATAFLALTPSVTDLSDKP